MSDALFVLIVGGSIVVFCIASLCNGNNRLKKIQREVTSDRDGRIFEVVEEAQGDFEEHSRSS